MSGSIRELWGRALTVTPFVVLPFLLLGVVKYAGGPVVNPDTYFHLRLGGEFLDGWSARDPASVTTFATADWTPTQWLGQMLFAWSERAGGLEGVSTLTSLLALATVLAFFFSARPHSSFGVAVALVVIAVPACLPFLSGRPQMFSYALAAVVTSGWLSCARGGRIPWWVVPLTWLWATLHGMWIVSVLVSCVAVLGLSLERRISVADAWRFVAVPSLSLAVVALTPMGTDAYAAVTRVGGISDYFAEWGPTDFSEASNLLALTLSGLVAFIWARRRVAPSWTVMGLAALGTLWLLYSGRTVPVGVAILLPVAGATISWKSGTRPVKLEPLVVLTTSFVIAGTVLLTSPAPQEGLRAASQAHQSVALLPRGTALLNEWDEGGYDMWRHPHLNIVMHGYGDMFTNEELERNDDLGRLQPGWYEEVQCMGLEHALLYEDSALAHALQVDKGWAVSATDGKPEADGFTDRGLVHLHKPYSLRDTTNLDCSVN